MATNFTPIHNSRRRFSIGLLALFVLFACTGRSLAQTCSPLTLPYFEGFEGDTTAGTVPTCASGTTGTQVVLTPSPSMNVPHNGNKFLEIPQPGSFAENIFVTPALVMDSGHTYNFTFWYKTTGPNSKITARFDTLVGTSAFNFWFNTPITTITSVQMGAGVYTYALATGSFVCPYSTGSNYEQLRLGIVVYSGASGQYDHVDDINIMEATQSSGMPSLNVKGPSSICSGVTFNLYDSANLFTYGINYQWQSSPAGANTFVNIPGATTNSYITSITAATDYRLVATDTGTHLTDTSAIQSVTITPQYDCYCHGEVGSNIGGGGFTPLIDSVYIVNTNFHNQTFTALPNAYAVFPPTGTTTVTLYKGSTYTIAALMNTLGATAEAWLDINHNGVFDAISPPSATAEYIPMTASFLSYTSTGTFTVPTGALTGLTGLRIRSGGTGSNTDACLDITTGGETEDYIVNIQPEPFNDLSATAVLQPATGSSVCANSGFTVTVNVSNTGSLPQTNFLVGATYPGDPTPLYATYPGTLAANSSASFVIGTMTIPTGGTYSLKAYTLLSNDQNPANDTFYSNVVVSPLPPDPVVHSDTVCSGQPDTISVDPVPGTTFNWYNAPSGGAVVYTGTQQIFPSLTNNVTYYVSATTPGVTGTMVAGTFGATNFGCSGGIMFNVTPNANLTIDSFQVNFSDVGFQPVSIYYRIGSYAGNQTNPGAWYFLGSTAVQVNNTSLPFNISVNAPFNMNSGNNYAFYMVYDAQVTPSIPATSATTYTGADMTISNLAVSSSPVVNAAQLCGFFSNENTAAQSNFFGQIFYHIGGSDCESNRIAVSAAVGPKPIVDLGGTNETVCYSPTLSLDAGNPGATYLWNTGDTTQKIHLIDSGIYSVTVTKYCATSSALDTVYVLPVPTVVGINYVNVNGNTYIFSASGVQNVTGYQWDFGDHTGSNSPNPTHTYATANAYRVKLVVFNSMCGSDTLSWSVPSTGVVNVNATAGDISMYPNPASTSVTVNAIDDIDLKSIVIFNAIGQEVYHGTASNSKTEHIDISMLAPGNYILRAKTSGGTFNKTFGVVRQ